MRTKENFEDNLRKGFFDGCLSGIKNKAKEVYKNKSFPLVNKSFPLVKRESEKHSNIDFSLSHVGKVFLVVFFLGGLLFSQSAGELRLEKEELLEQIKRLKQEMEADKKDTERFLEQKRRLLMQKEEEEISIRKEIDAKRLEISRTRRELGAIELAREQIVSRDRSILASMLNRAKDLREGMEENDIPFESERRLSTLSDIIYDIEASRISASEAVNRFFAFLDNEQLMGYDAAIVRSVVNIGDAGAVRNANGSIMRIGRIFFAFNSEEGVFLFKKNENGRYVLDKTTLTLDEQRRIREAFDMIEGRRPPDFHVLPIEINEESSEEELQIQ